MDKPNVLIILTDQQRYDTISALGYAHMITPNLDRLVKKSCSYMYAHSTNPVCMPARHDLLTGRPGRAHGYYVNRRMSIKDHSLPTIPRVFSENGYRTAAVGKMHFCPAREHHGFGEMFLMEELPIHRQDDQYLCHLAEAGLGHVQNIHGVRPHVYHIPQRAQMDQAHHGTTWVGDKTIDWLQSNGQNPFFLMTGFIQPHPPWSLPDAFEDLYSQADIPDAIPRSRKYPFVSEECAWYGDNDSEQHKRKIREAYFASVTMIDRQIGRIIDYLETSALMDQTLIIFTSDHGEMLQDKGFYSKELPYEGSVRIPMLIHYPNNEKAGEVCEDFVDLFDIFPTCLDVCGLKYPEGHGNLQGESLYRSSGGKDRSYQTSATGAGGAGCGTPSGFGGRWVMSRNKRYKYVYYYHKGTEELYDMAADPSELRDLISAGDYPKEAYRELKDKAISYERQCGPEGLIQNDAFIEMDCGEYEPFVNSKFPLWCLYHMQKFDEREPGARGEQFLKEIQYALARPELSGIALEDVFCDPDWMKEFIRVWKVYGGSSGENFDALFGKLGVSAGD